MGNTPHPHYPNEPHPPIHSRMLPGYQKSGSLSKLCDSSIRDVSGCNGNVLARYTSGFHTRVYPFWVTLVAFPDRKYDDCHRGALGLVCLWVFVYCWRRVAWDSCRWWSCQTRGYRALCNDSSSIGFRETSRCHWTWNHLGKPIFPSDLHSNFAHIRHRLQPTHTRTILPHAFWCRIWCLLLQSAHANTHTHINWTMDQWYARIGRCVKYY